MTTFSDQLRFPVEEGNIASGQDAEFLRQTQVAAGKVASVRICPLDDVPIDLIASVAVFQVPDVFRKYCAMRMLSVSEREFVVVISCFKFVLCHSNVFPVVVVTAAS